MTCQEPRNVGVLRNTVKPYGRHVLLLTGRDDWDAHLVEEDALVGRIARDVRELADEVTPKPKATALTTPSAGEGLDLFVYPEGVAYRGIDAAAWTRIRDEHLKEGRVVADLAPQPLTGADVLVCVHGARDHRCGGCGPLVRAAIEEGLAARGRGDVRVHGTSHVGGHAFAGNVIIYPGGTWYGYVRPEVVADLLDGHFGEAPPLADHVRGRAAAP